MKSANQIERKIKQRYLLREKLLGYLKDIAIAVLIIILVITIATSDRDLTKGQVIEHTVKYYEINLTQIANEYYPDVYLPKALTDIKKLNNMIESDIYVGQVLRIEVK